MKREKRTRSIFKTVVKEENINELREELRLLKAEYTELLDMKRALLTKNLMLQGMINKQKEPLRIRTMRFIVRVASKMEKPLLKLLNVIAAIFLLGFLGAICIGLPILAYYIVNEGDYFAASIALTLSLVGYVAIGSILAEEITNYLALYDAGKK